MKKFYVDSDADGKSSSWSTCWRMLMLFSFSIFMMGQFSFARSVFQTSYNSSGAVTLNTVVSPDRNSLEQPAAQTAAAFFNHNFASLMSTGIIGSGTINTNGQDSDPINDYYMNMSYHVVYIANELSGIGMSVGDLLNGLGWSVSQSPGTLKAYTIKIGHTTAANAGALTYFNIGDMTTVKNPFSYTPTKVAAGNFDMISFDSDFYWNGTDNIVVGICTSYNNLQTPPYGGVRADPMATGSRWSAQWSGGGVCDVLGSAEANRPQVQFSYTQGLACEDTPNLGNTVASVQNACADVNFTLSLENRPTSPDVTYQWESADDAEFSTNVASMGMSSSQVTSQTSAKWYRCTVTCNTSGESGVSVPVFVGLNPSTECYCTPAASGGATVYYITNFTTSGGLTNINNTSGGSTEGYQDFSAITMTVYGGTEINYSISVAGAQTYYAYIWVDWDENGTFETGEQVVNSVHWSYHSPLTGNFTIPYGTASGNKRMRIAISESSIYGYDGGIACSNYYEGEYEDYTLVFQSQSCTGIPDAGTATVNPSTANAGSDYQVKLENYSNVDGLTFAWRYRINGGEWQDSAETGASFTATASGNAGDTTEWKATVSCTNSGLSAESTTATFTTSFVYCTPSGGNMTYYISNFTTTGGVTNINNASGGSATGYQDFSAITMTTEAGAEIGYSISAESSNTYTYTYGRAIWVDWNENGTFEAGEQVVSSTSKAVSPLTGSFTVPYGTLPGSKRVRIGASLYSISDPCGVYYGEYEDYTLIVASSDCTTGIPMATVSPSTGIAGSGYQVKLENYVTGGGLTFAWQYRNNGGAWQNSAETGIGFTATAPDHLGPVEWKATVTCTASGLSAESSTATFTTVYCKPTGSAASYYISNFTTSGGLTNINNTSGNSATGYQDFSAISMSAVEGTEIGYSISGAGDNYYRKAIWVDWNENGTFEAGEQVVNSTSYKPSPLTGSFSVPYGTLSGSKRMRILAFYNAAYPSKPCGNTGQGEYEDYTLVVSSLEGCTGTPDAGTIAFSAYEGCPAYPYTVSLNGYTADDGIEILWEYRINNGNWMASDETGAIFTAPGLGNVGDTTEWKATLTCTNSGQSASVVSDIHSNICTLCVPYYSSSNNYVYIEKFKLKGDNGTSINRTFEYGGGESYLNNTDESVDLTSGGTYAGLIRANGSINTKFTIWLIDENGLATLVVPTTDLLYPASTSFNLNVPVLPEGTYTMRVMLTANYTPVNECTPNSAHGQTIDYTAHIHNYPYVATSEASPAEGGSITEGNGTYQWGNKVKFKTVPNENYKFVNWTVGDEIVSITKAYKFNITQDTHAVANFTLKDYVVVTKSAPAAGGTTEGGGAYPYNTEATVTATTNEGYEFINWTDADGNVVSTAASYSFTVSGKVKLTANFAPTDFAEVTTSPNPAEGGITTGDGTYAYNAKVTVKAVPNYGYVFVNWTVDGNEVSVKKTYKFSTTENVDLVANFAPKDFEVITKVKPAAGGSTTGDGIYAYNSEATVTATANASYTFVNWTDTDGNELSYEPSYSFTVTGKTKVFANFVKNAGGGGNEKEIGTGSDIFSYYPNPVKDILYIRTGHDIQSVSVYNLATQEVMSLNAVKAANGKVDVRLLPQGIYIFTVVLDNGEVKTFKIVKK